MFFSTSGPMSESGELAEVVQEISRERKARKRDAAAWEVIHEGILRSQEKRVMEGTLGAGGAREAKGPRPSLPQRLPPRVMRMVAEMFEPIRDDLRVD
jgi:hypothetical protein